LQQPRMALLRQQTVPLRGQPRCQGRARRAWYWYWHWHWHGSGHSGAPGSVR
jgi:hypothetical protein